MLTDSLSRIYAKVFGLQCVISLVLVLVLLPFSGYFSVSALVGSVSVLIGNACYMIFETRGEVLRFGSTSKTKRRLGGRIFGRHLVAELLKIAVIAGLLATAMASGRFDALWVVIAASVVIVGHGLAFLIVR